MAASIFYTQCRAWGEIKECELMHIWTDVYYCTSIKRYVTRCSLNTGELCVFLLTTLTGLNQFRCFFFLLLSQKGTLLVLVKHCQCCTFTTHYWPLSISWNVFDMLRFHEKSLEFRREDTWRLIVLTLLVKSLAALTKVSKDTVPGYAVRHTSCWKNIQPWKWITSLSSHAHRVFNHTDRHTNLNIPLKRYTRTHTHTYTLQI